nr:hypothetical protein [Tanacetum cinerariifolium]
MNYYEPNPCYDSNYSGFDQFQPSQSVIDHLKIHEDLQQWMKYLMIELRETFQAWLQQQVVNLDSYSPEPLQYRKIPIYYDDDDDKESSTPLRDIIISELPSCIAITPILSTEEPKDTLIMGDEHLDTIPKKESDEFIKSSFENLVSSPSESEDISDGDDEKSSSDEDVPKENFKFFSNPLSDEEIIYTKIDPHHFNDEFDLIESFLNRDTSIVSSPKFDCLLEEFSGELAHIDLISLEIDETDFDPEEEIRFVERLLYDNSSSRPSKELNSKNSDAIIESFSPSPILIEDSDSLREKIDLFLTSDDSMPPSIENDGYDSEGDIPLLKEFLSNDSHSLPKNESFRFYVPSSTRPRAKPPDDGIYFEPIRGVLTTKVVGNISKHYVLMPRILPTQPTLCPVIDTLLPFSSENKDKVHLLSHRGFIAFQLISDSPMMIYGGNVPTLEVPFLYCYPP